jgi:hypothetical protein
MDADGSRAGQERQAVRPPSQSFTLVQMVAILVVGLAAGAAATWMLTLGSLDRAAPWVDTFVNWVLPALGFAGVMLVLLVPLTWWGCEALYPWSARHTRSGLEGSHGSNSRSR